jgi:membrane protein YdbS with pleckstrin-like domain
MARGNPGVWSSLLSIPFLASGAYVYLGQTPYPPVLGLPLLLFAGFIIIMGWYIHLVAAPPKPTLRDAEEILGTRHPTQKAAMVRVLIGIPCFVVSGYLFLGTVTPYVYPTVAFTVGLYLMSTGILTYWTNSLTTYYLTSDRVMSEFRLISLVRKEVPISKVRAVKESKSPIEALVGVGNLQVSSGGGAGTSISITNIDSATDFAEELRRLT